MQVSMERQARDNERDKNKRQWEGTRARIKKKRQNEETKASDNMR